MTESNKISALKYLSMLFTLTMAFIMLIVLPTPYNLIISFLLIALIVIIEH